MLTTDENYDTLSVKEVARKDIEAYAEELKITPRQLMKDFSKNTTVVFRTLEKFVSKSEKFNPHVETIVSVYSQIYGTNSVAEIMSKAPHVISEYIKNNYTVCVSGIQNISELSRFNREIDILTKSDTFNEIYILTGGTYGTEVSTIREQLGLKGLKILDQMIKFEFVIIDKNDRLLRKNKLDWSNPVRKSFIQTFLNGYDIEKADLENRNLLNAVISDVTVNDFNLIVKKMTKNYFEVVSIMNNSNPSQEEAIRIVLGDIVDRVDF